ncbi:EAL domain-containing protein [Synechococcus sp. RSCCF101]|uniref:EAL domain-containing protein n=1 Tax=Synechococcus sp. RSCCF101 TaxID=2511069 RepID=UPI0017815D45|nr:EAL domain-containing protein [Synechococcus sp. RSCCF101]
MVCEALDQGSEYRIATFNRAAEAIEGLSRQQVIGKELNSVFTAAEDFGLARSIRDADRQQESRFLPGRIYKDDRICGWREYSIKPIRPGLVLVLISSLDAKVVASLQRDTVDSDRRYELLAESTLDGIWEWEPTSGSLHVSDHWKQQLGYRPDELDETEAMWRGLMHPDDRALVFTSLQSYLRAQDKSSWQVEYRMRCRNGEYSWILARGARMENAGGTSVTMLGVHIDINEQKRLEQRLQEKDLKNRLAMAAGAMGSWSAKVTSGAIGEITWSDGLEQIMGMKPGSFRGEFQQLRACIHPEDVMRWQDDVMLFQSGAKEHDLEFRVIALDGTVRWVHAQGQACRNDQGEVTMLIGVTQDITRRKADELRLRQAAAVFADTTEGVVITDLEAAILDVNAAFETVTGYSREEVLGQNPRLLKSGRHDSAFYEELWSTLIETGRWKGEIWNRRKNGSIYPSLCSISTVLDGLRGAKGYVAVFADISMSKQTQDRLHFLSNHDPLTGLANRLLFDALLKKRIEAAHRHRSMLAVVYFDLDNFKAVNDSLGHLVGDELLQLLADRLIRTLRTSDTVARIGGDEFVLLLDELTSAEQASRIAEKVLKAVQAPFLIGKERLYSTCSMGISLYPQDGGGYVELMNNADMAMYRAKELGRNRIFTYSQEMSEASKRGALLISDIGFALGSGQFSLYYQPQVHIASRQVKGLEVLLRWTHPEIGAVPPSQFIPVAERSGLIRELGEYVLTQACYQARLWLDQDIGFGYLAVNVAGSQIQQVDFVDTVANAIAKSALPPECLELEVTESFMMKGIDTSIDQLDRLKTMGIATSIDDFGTGYSSLAYLKRLPVSKLKIDQSFIAHLPDDPNDSAVTEAVIALAHALKLELVAEGVEREDQAAFLDAHGCHIAQGYLYSKPVPAAAIERMLA